jgi:hypothetical protein
VSVTLLLGLVTWEKHTGYFGPAFSPDGRLVYAISRETTGVTWGLGWEHFTPPAYAYALSDRLVLVRIDVATGSLERLESWSATPVTRRVVRDYRGRVFTTISATVRPLPEGIVHYAVEITIPKAPASEVHALAGTWADTPGRRQSAAWQPARAMPAGASEPIVFDETEVFALEGPESFPCAIVLLDHRARTTRVLVGSSAYARQYREGPPVETLLALSRKKEVGRVAEVKRVVAEPVVRPRADGHVDGDPVLKAYRDEDPVHLPKSSRMIAELLAPGVTVPSSLPLFEIEGAEMASGVFPDLERALASPGTDVPKFTGRYVARGTSTTSARLNEHVERGGREFLVRFGGTTYRVEIR